MRTLSPVFSLFVTLTASITFGLSGDKPKLEPTGGSGGLTPPRVLNRVAPSYPDRAILNGLAGVVLLEIPVDKSGKAGKPGVLRSSGSDLLDVSAICCVMDWRFEPARRKGKRRASVCRQEIGFKLPPPERLDALRRAASETDPPRDWRPFPPYPRASINNGHQGRCELEVTWTTNGYIADIKLRRSSGYPELDWSALRTVYCQWRLDTTRFPAGAGAVYQVPCDFRIGL